MFVKLGLLLIFFVIHVCNAGTVPGVGLNKTLTLGYLLSWSHEWAAGPYIGSAIVVAIREIQQRQLLPGYNIEWLLEDSWCERRQGIKAAITVWSRARDLDAVIGDGCSTVCEPVSLLGAAWSIPVISYGCSSGVLSDKTVYSTFIRTVGTTVHRAEIFYQLTRIFDWNRVGIIAYSTELFLAVVRALDKLIKSGGGRTFIYTSDSTISASDNTENISALRQILHILKNDCRIIFILMYSLDVRNVLALAHEEGMLEGFVYIGSESELPLEQVTSFRPDLGNELYEGVIDLEVSVNTGSKWDIFRQDVIDSFQSTAFDGWDHLGPNASIEEVNGYAGMIHDAVLVWASGVNTTLEQGYPPDNGFRITQNLLNFSFEGITGTVVIDGHGDRKSDFAINMVQNGKAVTVIDYIAAGNRYVKRINPGDEYNWEGLVWPGKQTTIPRDSPPCGWNMELCSTPDKSTTVTIATATTVVASLFIFVLAGSIIVHKLRFERQLKEAISCIISWSDVDTKQQYHDSVITLASVAASEKPQINLFCPVVRYKSEVAAVKLLGSQPVSILERKVLMELKDMKELHHNNINTFIGVCLESPNACVLMAYASHGSLQDVLFYDDSTLTWDFKISFITDIANGMKYIQSNTPGWHGRLTSKNCVVDNRWVCKITDYGLHYVRHCSTSSGQNVLSVDALFWTAPELLRANKDSAEGAKKGDVYSFGIICQEIILQCPPYGENENQSVSEIISNVKHGFIPPFRPHIAQGSCPEEWLDLITTCWQEDPELRPNFSRIVTLLKYLKKGKDQSLVDSMIKNLEYHSTKLENIVAQQSIELVEEREKIEYLLLELLPTSIAEQLKLGRRVDPESFDDVTIFFSDIVGFTRISAAGTPIDVVKMLNLMYTLFDDISAKFDVYKVATIGDAYFVASGVPIRNGDRHAVEICSMALELLNVVSSLPVPHLPDETLQMRIGIHSGPCLAGVVGIKMPRYLLFGETVEIASKMESGGECMRINISQSTKALLPSNLFGLEKHDGGLKAERDLKTYWLFKV